MDERDYIALCYFFFFFSSFLFLFIFFLGMGYGNRDVASSLIGSRLNSSRFKRLSRELF